MLGGASSVWLVDQRANPLPPDHLVRADRDAVAPLPNLAERQSMRYGRCANLDLECRPGRDGFTPFLPLQQGDARGRGFVECFRGHVDRMPDAAEVYEAHRTRSECHYRMLQNGCDGLGHRGGQAPPSL